MDEQLAEAVTWMLEQLAARQFDYAEAQAYYDGDQRSTLDLDRVRSTLGRLFADFDQNLCAPVVDIVRDRIVVRGFDDNGALPDEPAEPGGNEADALWDLGLMDAQQAAVHQDALVLGDSYLLVWPSAAGVPTLYPSSGTQTMIRYSEDTPGRADMAVKTWVEDRPEPYQRITVYLPDRIERYFKEGGKGELLFEVEGLEPYTEDDSGPVVANPWGLVPVFGFHNVAGLGKLGTSLLRDVIPLQDGLNKSVIDMVVGMEANAYPQRWATGVEVPLDETGAPAAWKPTDAVWTTPTPDAQFGAFPAADSQNAIAVQEAWARKICQVSGVPMHLLLGVEGAAWPSGRALEVAEARLVKLAEGRQVTWGTAWSAAMGLALTQARSAPQGAIETLWVPAYVADEQTQAETALLKQQLGVSNAQLQRELGYSAEQVTLIAEEAESERAAASTAAARGLGLA